MNTTAQQIRAYRGAAIWSFGFRPFFLFGAAWAALAVGIWLPLLYGTFALPVAYNGAQWHVHELIFGYVPAIIAGFLLTAVPNWTGTLPVVGTPLIVLFLVWLAGRVAILTSLWIGKEVAALIDLAFLLFLSAVVGREIIAARNWKNLRVLAVVMVSWIGNVVFHGEALAESASGYGARIGIAAAVFLIALIGGRIIPSFTRNWLAQRRHDRLPKPFDRFDIAAVAVTGLALSIWIVLPEAKLTSFLAVLAAAFNTVRLARWRGIQTLSEPLVAILHVGFAFVPIGFALLAASILMPHLLAPTGALHGWTVGSIGIMTLAVMTRASLGHTGRPLAATWPIQSIYVLITLAALTRIAAAFFIFRDAMLALSAVAWVAAFFGFFAVYAPLLVRPRP